MRILSIFFATVALAACQQDPLAGPCNEEARIDRVYELITPDADDNVISQDPSAFLNCETFICLSTGGTKPYCTRICASDEECLNGNGIAMKCRVVTEFGPLACRGPAHEFCPEDAADAELCCERDPATNAVLESAMYCAAEEGAIPLDLEHLNRSQ